LDPQTMEMQLTWTL